MDFIRSITRRGFLEKAGQGLAVAAASDLLVNQAQAAQEKAAAVVATADEKKIGYAVVGLGKFATTHILPGFAHAENSKVVALVGCVAKTAIKYNEPLILTLESLRGRIYEAQHISFQMATLCPRRHPSLRSLVLQIRLEL